MCFLWFCSFFFLVPSFLPPYSNNPYQRIRFWWSVWMSWFPLLVLEWLCNKDLSWAWSIHYKLTFYVVTALTVDVFRLINFLLATNIKKDNVFFCLTFLKLLGEGAEWAPIARSCFCLTGNYINRTLFPPLKCI